MSEPTPPRLDDDRLLLLLESEIAQARERQYQLQRDAEIAQVKSQIVGEYRVKFMDLLDGLRLAQKQTSKPE